MAEAMNPELQEALQEAGAAPKSARAAARSVASAGDMTKMLIWIKSLMAMGGLLVAINAVMLAQMFTLTAQVSENKASIAALNERVGKLEEGQERLELGQQEIISLLRTRLSESAPVKPGDAPEVSAAPTHPTRPAP